MSHEEVSPGGSRIHRHDQPAGGDEIPLAGGDAELIDAVSNHVERHLGPVEDVFHEIISPFAHIDLLHVAPGERRPWHTLVTCGMSSAPMAAPTPEQAFAELTLALPADWPMGGDAWNDERHYWPARLLKFLARLPHEHATWLGPGHTVPNDDPPEPYAPGTRLCGVILGPAQLTPDSFDVLDRPAGPIAFHGVVALHREEMDFKLASGAKALFDRLAAADVTELVRPDRPSVVAARRRGLFRRR